MSPLIWAKAKWDSGEFSEETAGKTAVHDMARRGAGGGGDEASTPPAEGRLYNRVAFNRGSPIIAPLDLLSFKRSSKLKKTFEASVPCSATVPVLPIVEQEAIRPSKSLEQFPGAIN